jgi:hypothetical protein
LPRERPVEIELPAINSASSAVTAVAGILNAVEARSFPDTGE